MPSWWTLDAPPRLSFIVDERLFCLRPSGARPFRLNVRRGWERTCSSTGPSSGPEEPRSPVVTFESTCQVGDWKQLPKTEPRFGFWELLGPIRPSSLEGLPPPRARSWTMLVGGGRPQRYRHRGCLPTTASTNKGLAVLGGAATRGCARGLRPVDGHRKSRVDSRPQAHGNDANGAKTESRFGFLPTTRTPAPRQPPWSRPPPP